MPDRTANMPFRFCSCIEFRESLGKRAQDVHLLLLPPTANIEINALQQAAAIVLQKSTREGFGLTVTEAMWKGKPVIGGETGGITAQVIHGKTGYTSIPRKGRPSISNTCSMTVTS